MGDPFIRTYIDDVLKNIRTQVLIKLIKPYTRIDISFISKVSFIFYFTNKSMVDQLFFLKLQQLNVPEDEVEELLVGLILDERILGKIDQVNRRLELERRSTDARKYEALAAWSENVSNLSKTVMSKAT
jgi:COP9 signalosome complex subunit 2